MNETWALNLIKNTFENSFDRERFLIFAKNLFHFLDTDPFIYRGNLIPDAYESHIKTLERIGKYEDVEGRKIEVLAVCLDKESSLERARTLQRNFIAWYLNGSRGGVAKDAALVAFYTKDSDDWRLSLVKMDYHLGESKAGKIKAITEFTPARRFSFLVGANENTHTAQRQLLPILKDTDFKPALSDLESAFSVEVVTKDFFEKYKKLFLNTKEALDAIVAKDAKIKSDFQEKNIDTTDFAKKLLGQIVFLYFLQKKGWFGVARDAVWGTGPKDFLRRLFEKTIAPYDNFFNDTLEPLFYEVLAVERTDDFYSKFNCKIPFLNGGLFDPLGNYDWVHTDICLPDELFSNNRKTKEGDTGDGILDVFDRYNFTVKEDEPLEREVAVDPEMLGKVFENLLEVKDRKSKGTYYTPREIVHYMCQESLINYLLTELNSSSDGGRKDSSEVELVSRDDIETLIRLGETAIENEARVINEGRETKDYHFRLPQSIRQHAGFIDEKLEKIHVCDPAVGSGAFLVGMMTEVIRVRNILTNYLLARRSPGEGGSDNGRSIYDFKRHAIQNCLYGVDIDPGAVEIAKLRLWLSLIVDEQDIKQIKPLPNLDYKIMQGNSLLEEYEGVKLDVDGHDQPQQMKFDQAKTESEILKERLADLRKEFFRTAHKTEKDKLKEQIEDLTWQLIETSLKEQKKLSLLSEIELVKKTNIKPFFLWRLNFAEVFAEKGGFDVVIANPPYVQFQKLDLKMRNHLRKHQYYESQSDLWYFFVYKAFDLLCKKGKLTFIVSNYFLQAGHADTLRSFITDYLKIISIVNFTDRHVFESVGVHSVIIFLEKDNPDKYNFPYLKCDDVNKLGSTDNDVYIINKSSLGKTWMLVSGDEANLLNKLLNMGQPLGMFTKISNGIKSGDDMVFVVKKNSVDEKLIEEKLLKDYLKNSEIHRYYLDKPKKRIIYSDSNTDLDKYPLFRSYVVPHRGSLEAKWKKRGEVSDYWKLYRPREEMYLSDKQLTISSYRTNSIGFALNGDCFSGTDTYLILNHSDQIDEKVLLGILNSKLICWIYRKIGKRKGSIFEIATKELSLLPIVFPSKQISDTISKCVDKLILLAGRAESVQSEIKREFDSVDKVIDELVYKLYGLTPEKITVVEGKNGQQN